MAKAPLETSTICYLDFRSRLHEEFIKRKAKKTNFSLRSFGRHLKTDASTLQKIMDGRRPLGGKTIQKLGLILGLSEAEISAYVHAHKERRRLATTLAHDKRRAEYTVLGVEFADLVTKLETYAILELLELPDFEFSAKSVAEALGLSNSSAFSLIQQLESVGWIGQKPDGKWANLLGDTTTNPLDPTMSESRRALMKSIIERSSKAYRELPKGVGLFYARTLIFDRALLGSVMAKIRNFSEDLEMMVEKEGKPKDIYQLQLGFFPLTTFFKKEVDHRE